MRYSFFSSKLSFRGLSAIIGTALLLSTLSFAPPVDAQSSPRVAVISRDVPVPGSDEALVAHLREVGWSVALIDDDRIRDSGKNAISGFDLVVISSSVYPPRIQWRLRSAPEPIIVTEPLLYPAFRMTETGSGNWGLTTSSRKVQITNPRNPLSAGLEGEVFVATNAKPMNYGIVGSGAYVVATAKDSDDQAVIFAYEAGDRMADGEIAAGPRVGFYMTQPHPRFANRDGWALFDAAAKFATPNAPDVSNGDLPDFGTLAPRNGTLLGANVSNENSSSRYEAVLAFQRQIRRELDIVNRFHEFSAALTGSFFWDRQHIEDGRTVMISWRATDNPGSVNGQPDARRASKIVAGQFDRQIEAMATAVRDLEAPVLLRFNWEMDQDPGDPQYIGTPEQFIAAWRYVHDIFEERGATNVEWVWAPRARSFAKDVGPTFYPGSDYVDWIGGSAVPINSFTDAQTIYSDWNRWASNRGKPQLLWLGLRENPDDRNWKSRFITEIRSLASGDWPGLKAFVYYNSNSPLGFDYTIDTSTSALSAFRNLACDPQFTELHGC